MDSSKNKILKVEAIQRASSFKRQLTPIAAACAMLAMSAQAQVAPIQTADEPTVVTVTGIRMSLNNALDLKRESRGWVDGVVAEDIGKFPDGNLAESMQRISGVSIDRSIGEGSKITVRGVGPDFNTVLLNGRQMPASTINDTSASNSRAFDFSNLATESISSLVVYKTSRASSPTGGIGATINITTARPLDVGPAASFGAKLVTDQSNSRLPESFKGNSLTPELSGIYSSTFGDRMFGVAISGSYQKRNGGFNQAGSENGWRTFRGSTNDWGTIPQNGTPGSERIVNRPGPNDTYSVPQNIKYSVNGIARERTNGQLTLQFAPMKNKDLVATLDFTASENKVHTKRQELSAWFNFGPSSSTWTGGNPSAPLIYSETTNGKADIGMGAGEYGNKNTNQSTGLNLAWKATKSLSFEFDAHHSTAVSGSDSPYGNSANMGMVSFNRGDTFGYFDKDFPVLSLPGTSIDASKMLLTGFSFRNSYMKSVVDQVQAKGKFKLEDSSKLEFGLGSTKVGNRSAFSNVQTDSWGGFNTPDVYPDSVFHPETLSSFFGRINGSNDPRQFNQFFTYDFKTVRDLSATAANNQAQFQASPNFTTDRRVTEKSQSAYLDYSKSWDTALPFNTNIGVRYEKTDVTSSALVPSGVSISWNSDNEIALVSGPAGFSTASGSYKYFLPNLDADLELTDKIKLRGSYGMTIGRPGWNSIQGGQTLNSQVRVNGGTGQSGNPGLKPLKSKNLDLSLEYYYAKSSYVALGAFSKKIDNFIGTQQVNGTPYNLHTPIGGKLYLEAVNKGGCATSNNGCIRNYIFANYNGTRGVTATGIGANGNMQGTIVGQSDDPLTIFALQTPVNARKDTLKGLEFNAQHLFGNSGYGLSANYTYVKAGLKFDNTALLEQYALLGVSNSSNLVGFYENDKWSVRAAYNWRGEFLSSLTDGAGLNPQYTEPYAQIDMSFGYKWSDKLSFQGEILNLNDGFQRIHSRAKSESEFVTQTGRRFAVAARYKF